MHISLEEESQVNEKTIQKVEKAISEQDSVMLIHANWCMHCQHFMPTWKASQKTFKKAKMTPINIESSALDKVQQNKKIAKKIHNKDGIYFPMIIFFFRTSENKTVKKIYNGDRSEEAMKKFMDKHKKKYAAAPATKGGAASTATTATTKDMTGGSAKSKGKKSKSVEHEVNEILNNYFKL